MQKLLILLAVITMGIACKDVEKKDVENTDSEVVEVPVFELKDFHAKAAAYVDKEVITKGIVDHVCKHGGKKLFLVVDDADLHINGEERFDEELMGSEIEVTGIVREFRVDEGYCLQMEEDNINSHSEGETDDDLFERKQEDIAYYRDSMKVAGVDHLSYYSLDYVSHKVIK